MTGCLWFRGMVSICLIRKDKCDWFLHKWILVPWLAHFSSMSGTICLLLKIFRQNKFFIVKSVSSFPTSVCTEASQIFCSCNHEDIILNRSNNLKHLHLSKEVVLLENTILKFQILPRADKKRFCFCSLRNNPFPIMFHCAKICFSYWLSITISKSEILN